VSTTQDSAKSRIQNAIAQFYEDEGLTDALTDEAAKILLSWSEKELKNVAELDPNSANLYKLAFQLRRVAHSINRLVERQPELSQTQLVEELIGLVERAAQFAKQKSKIEEETRDDKAA
jgi:hypothetical protein